MCKVLYSLQPSVTVPKNDKAKFKAALIKYLHTHSYYFANEFLCVKVMYKGFGGET